MENYIAVRINNYCYTQWHRLIPQIYLWTEDSLKRMCVVRLGLCKVKKINEDEQVIRGVSSVASGYRRRGSVWGQDESCWGGQCSRAWRGRQLVESIHFVKIHSKVSICLCRLYENKKVLLKKLQLCSTCSSNSLFLY